MLLHDIEGAIWCVDSKGIIGYMLLKDHEF